MLSHAIKTFRSVASRTVSKGTSLRNIRNTCGHSAAPQVTRPAPDFKGTAVVGGAFKEISLDDYKGNYLVLFFYPLDFTFVCPTEIIAFSDKMKDFNSIDTNVVAVSCDSQFSHLAWANLSRKQGGLGGVNMPMLSDYNKNIAKDYGVLIEEKGIPLRGLFVIDGNGVLRHSCVNDFGVGRSVDETLRLVQAFQFTDKHGEVCPASWSPGQKTIKPSVEESKEYFESAN